MEQEIRYLDFEGRRLAYSTYGEGRRSSSARAGSRISRRNGPTPTRGRSMPSSRARIAWCASTGSAAGSRRASSTRGPTVESESRQLEAVIDAVGGSAVVFASSCCCLAASQLAVRRPGATDRIVYFGGYATRNDIPEATKASLIAFIGSNWRARGADARRSLRPARVGRRDCALHAHAAGGGERRGSFDLPRARPERGPARPASARRGACIGAASPR